jgi:hypothetical protein
MMLSQSERDRLHTLYDDARLSALSLTVHYTGAGAIWAVLEPDGTVVGYFYREDDAYLFLSMCAITPRLLTDADPPAPIAPEDLPVTLPNKRGRPARRA